MADRDGRTDGDWGLMVGGLIMYNGNGNGNDVVIVRKDGRYLIRFKLDIKSRRFKFYWGSLNGAGQYFAKTIELLRRDYPAEFAGSELVKVEGD